MYTTDEIIRLAKPIAEKYQLKSFYLIGSYARGEANEESDIDFMYNKKGSNIKTLTNLSALYNDIRNTFRLSVDLVSETGMYQRKNNQRFIDNVERDKVIIYERP